MIVAIEENSKCIKEFLEKMGYEVVYAGEYNGLIDAYIYENDGFFIENDINTTLDNNTGENGILMINSKNKSNNDILKILRRKVYGDIINFL